MNSLAAALLVVIAPLAQPNPPDDMIAPQVGESPVVDGRLDDPCWQQMEALRGFSRPLQAEPPRDAVAVRACFRGDMLYLALEARALSGLGQSAPRQDQFEVWFRSGPRFESVKHLVISLTGETEWETPPHKQPLPAGCQIRIERDVDRWTSEAALPLAMLEVKPSRGAMIPIKIGRRDPSVAQPELAVWPARSSYSAGEQFGRLYLESANLLPNPDMSEAEGGQIARWNLGEADEGRFSSVVDRERRAIRFDAPGRYSTAQQSLRLKPNAFYRLEVEVRGTAGVYLRARTAAKGGHNTPFDVNCRPTSDYRRYEFSFPTGADGRALIILGNTDSLGRGEAFIANLRISEDIAYGAEGPGIPLVPNQPVVVKKLMVTDCRALRGFIVAPVDGRLDSVDWNMNVWEYGMRGAGAGVGYRYRENDGLHIELADDQGVDAVQFRGGARVKLYHDAARYDDPGEATPVWQFDGRAQSCRALFSKPIASRRWSFFGREKGIIADTSFLRLEDSMPAYGRRVALRAAEPADLGDLAEHARQRFGESNAESLRLANVPGQPVALEAGQVLHLVTDPAQEEWPLTAVALRFNLTGAPAGCPLTLTVHDPLNPRQDLMGVEFTVAESGPIAVALDFPDQIVLPGNRIWLTLQCGAAAMLGRVDVDLLVTSRDEALAEALSLRKLLMKGLFAALSEARQWNTFRRNMDLEQFYRENRWGPGVKELAETIAQCKTLDPRDPTVVCYDEWFWRQIRPLSDFTPRLDTVAGAPEWAVLARQAWLTAREVPQWWLDHRLVPTGEFGGLVGDDSDMYQNYADFPMFETGGTAAQVLAAAAALAELAEAENLENGLNRQTTDPLHAYEEGVNHEALMLWWNYGDPVYFERCLAASRSMPALTVVTKQGHRHFKNQECGAEDLRIDRPLGVDGDAHPLMLHPCFEVAWYNGSPQVLEFLRQWADAWLEHIRPDDYATAVDVKEEQVVARSSRPLDGGYGGQASAHNFLYWITGERRYIGPFMQVFEKGEDLHPARKFVPELWHRGALDGVEKSAAVLRGNPVTRAIALGDKSALCEALKNDIAELQRFRTMYTDAEVFTDRVFLGAISNAAQCYTGGYATRNKYNHTHAVSWEGLGTDYAALVLAARRDHFKCLLYNFAAQEHTGRARFWTLDHGRYRLTLGPDGDGNDQADAPSREETVQIARATPISIMLPPRTVTVLELKQTEKLDEITARADLAIAARELSVENGQVRGIVHNIGAAEASAFTIAAVDASGTVLSSARLGPLAAPVDLEPKRLPFRLPLPPSGAAACRVVVDPEGQIAEIFEENNAAAVP